MGAYTAFLDVALGFGGPSLGLLANIAGLGSVFLATTLTVPGSAIVALLLASQKATGPDTAELQRPEQMPPKIDVGWDRTGDIQSREGTRPQAPG
jgi:hypothetical protein